MRSRKALNLALAIRPSLATRGPSGLVAADIDLLDDLQTFLAGLKAYKKTKYRSARRSLELIVNPRGWDVANLPDGGLIIQKKIKDNSLGYKPESNKPEPKRADTAHVHV